MAFAAASKRKSAIALSSWPRVSTTSPMIHLLTAVVAAGAATECDAPIPEARRKAMPGVRLCVPCREAQDRDERDAAGYNRRGSKDSQLR